MRLDSLALLDIRYRVQDVAQLHGEMRSFLGVPQLEKQLQDCEKRSHALELEHQRLRGETRRLQDRLTAARRSSLVALGLAFLATVSIGIGINFVACADAVLRIPGVILIVIGGALQISGLVITQRRERTDV